LVYVAPMGVDPFLQDTPFTIRVRLHTGFAGRVRTGYYGQGKQIKVGSVSSAITAVGQAIVVATNTNPTKIVGSDKLLPHLQQMLDGFRKADPPTTKQLPVEADVPEFLVQLGLSPEARELNHALGDPTIPSKLRNSKWETSLSLPRTSKETFVASHGMPHRISSQWPMAPP